MKTKRLEILIEDLLAVAKAPDALPHFYLGSWGGQNGDPPTMTCNTSACAGGLATLDPRLRAMGLRNSADLNGSSSLAPYFGDESGFRALEIFFGLNHDQAERIFSDNGQGPVPEGPNGARKVVKRIRQVMKEG